MYRKGPAGRAGPFASQLAKHVHDFLLGGNKVGLRNELGRKVEIDCPKGRAIQTSLENPRPRVVAQRKDVRLAIGPTDELRGDDDVFTDRLILVIARGRHGAYWWHVQQAVLIERGVVNGAQAATSVEPEVARASDGQLRAVVCICVRNQAEHIAGYSYRPPRCLDCLRHLRRHLAPSAARRREYSHFHGNLPLYMRSSDYAGAKAACQLHERSRDGELLTELSHIFADAFESLFVGTVLERFNHELGDCRAFFLFETSGRDGWRTEPDT